MIPVIAAVIVTLIIIAFWHGLVTRKYTIYSGKIKSEIKIVLITDLHSNVYGKNQKDIASKIKKASPDLILLSGDIIDDVKPIEGAKTFFKAVKDIADVYYVTGNHDMVMSRIIGDIKKIVSSCGITVLDDKYCEVTVKGNNIVIGGVDDPGINRRRDSADYAKKREDLWEENIDNVFKDLDSKDDGRYKILLSHRPEKVDLYEKLPFDLILSGHAHGGQFRIPFILNGLYAPNQGLFPKYAGGAYEYAGKVHIVSRGVSFDILRPRLFNPPEVVVITLLPK